MMQGRALEDQVRAHQSDLMAVAGPRRASRRRTAEMSDSGATQRSAAGIPVAGGRAVRRARAPRLGAWLIDFGTRLGGASIRTS
jgi:hypothetical protein